ncbi:MAG: phytoene/squalene synthase family protein [Corynebacterium sp.]|nr:phytoene/squalene synthase family protein [Corynebacterium sp.]
MFKPQFFRTRPDSLGLYRSASISSAQNIMRAYSTSFSLASRLLPRRVRHDIGNLYALVRIADEIVDGPARDAGFNAEGITELLDSLEADFFRALHHGFDSNPAILACADTARRTRMPEEWFRAFFASMREDIHPRPHYSDEQLAAYIYGSAEVIGLMCVQIFRKGAAPTPEIITSARALGRAFQLINFVRDYAADSALGRHYIRIEDKARICEGIRNDLATARNGIGLLPWYSRPAVGIAYALFAALNEKLDQGDPRAGRIRLNMWEKQVAIGRFVLGNRN